MRFHHCWARLLFLLMIDLVNRLDEGGISDWTVEGLLKGQFSAGMWEIALCMQDSSSERDFNRNSWVAFTLGKGANRTCAQIEASYQLLDPRPQCFKLSKLTVDVRERSDELYWGDGNEGGTLQLQRLVILFIRTPEATNLTWGLAPFLSYSLNQPFTTECADFSIYHVSFNFNFSLAINLLIYCLLFCRI